MQVTPTTSPERVHRGTVTSNGNDLKANLLRYQTHLQFADPISATQNHKIDIKLDNNIYDFLDPTAPEIIHSKQIFWWSFWRKYLKSSKSLNDIRQSFRITREKERIEKSHGIIDNLYDILNLVNQDRLLLKKYFKVNGWILNFISLFIEIMFVISYLMELQHNYANPCVKETGNCYFTDLPTWILVNRLPGAFMWLFVGSIIKLIVLFLQTILSDNPVAHFFKPTTLVDFVTSLPFFVLSRINKGYFICILD
jgi:hypothetical protein